VRRTIFLAAAALGGAASGSALGPSKAADRVATHDFLYRRPGHGARARSAASAGLLAGAATRLLFDARQATTEATATAVGLALAPAQATAYATAWIAGFPRGSGLVLIHHRALFDLLDTWLGGLAEEVFREIVPLLRRAFAGFSAPGRRQLLELAGAAPAARGGRGAGLRLGARRAGAARATSVDGCVYSGYSGFQIRALFCN